MNTTVNEHERVAVIKQIVSDILEIEPADMSPTSLF